MVKESIVEKELLQCEDCHKKISQSEIRKVSNEMKDYFCQDFLCQKCFDSFRSEFFILTHW